MYISQALHKYEVMCGKTKCNLLKYYNQGSEEKRNILRRIERDEDVLVHAALQSADHRL